MFQRVYVNANDKADGIANVPSLWLMLTGRNMLYNLYLLQMLSIKTKRLTFERYLINQWMEFCVHSIGLSNLHIPMGRPVINAISFFLFGRANVFHLLRLIWHVYMTDYLVVLVLQGCVNCSSVSLAPQSHTVPYWFSEPNCSLFSSWTQKFWCFQLNWRSGTGCFHVNGSCNSDGAKNKWIPTWNCAQVMRTCLLTGVSSCLLRLRYAHHLWRKHWSCYLARGKSHLCLQRAESSWVHAWSRAPQRRLMCCKQEISKW